MTTSPLLPTVGKASTRSLVRTPLILLAVLVAALAVETKWMTSAAENGILLLHQTPQGWQKLPVPKGFPESLRISSGGVPWLLSVGRTRVSRWDGEAWQSYANTDLGIKTARLDREFALDGDEVWMPTGDGVLHWDGHAWHSDHDVAAGAGVSIVAGGGQVWLIDSAGKLSHFAEGRWHQQTLALPGVEWSENRFSGNPKLTRSQDGALWLTEQGLWRWDGSNWTRITAGADTLKDSKLLGSMGDRVWLSDGAGLRSVSLDRTHWTAYTNKQIGLEEQAQVSEVASAGGRTWFATSQGVLEFDGLSWRKLTLPGNGAVGARRVAAGPDGTLWIMGSSLAGSTGAYRYVVYLTILTPLAILVVIGWTIRRFRQRRLHQHERLTQAVQHATGEVPEELEAGAGMLKSPGIFRTAFLWIATVAAYVVLRRLWPQAPYWTIAAIGITIHLLMTFQQSLVKRRPKPYDPIGPGAPSRYNWAKSWKATAGAAVVLALVYLDRFPMLRFLRGYWIWILLFAPALYHTLAVYLLNRAARRGDYEGALKTIRWANFYNPSGMEPMRMSGHMLLAAGRYREAEDTLRRSLVSSQARESYGVALEYLGDALMEQGRYDEAMRSYEAALHAFPWRRRPYRGMAEMLLRRGEKASQALEYVEKIVDFSSMSWQQRKANGNVQDDYWGLKAWALARLGRPSEVAGAIESALQATNKLAAPDMASTHYRAGMAMQTLGNVSEANRHFKLAIQFDPNGRRGTLSQVAMRESAVPEALRV